MRLSSIVQAPGKINVGTTPIHTARDFAMKEFEAAGKNIDEILPNFNAGYLLLQFKIRKARNIPRAQMPVIRQQDIAEFQKFLEAKGIKAKILQLSPKVLFPTQSQIWLDKLVHDPLKYGKLVPGDFRLNLTIIAGRDGYILDGHHRIAGMLLTDPDLKIRTLWVNLKIDQLVRIGQAFMQRSGAEPRASFQEVQAKQEVVRLDEAAIQKWRKDLLLFLKNVDKIVAEHQAIEDRYPQGTWRLDETDRADYDKRKAKRDSDYEEFRQAARRLMKNYERFFFKGLIETGIKHRHLDMGWGDYKNEYLRQKGQENADYWEKRLRKSLWGVSFGLHDPYGPWEKKGKKIELQLWADRLRKAMRIAWKDLDDFVSWYKQYHVSQGKEENVDVPVFKADIVEIEGFRVKIVGYDPDDEHDRKTVEVLKNALKLYRQRAAATYPPMLKDQRPLILSFAHSGESFGGRYSPKYIIVNMLWMTEVKHAAQVLAHEISHHIYRTLADSAQRYWEQTQRADWGPLDLNKVLENWPAGVKFVSQYAESVQETDPEFSIQLLMLWSPYDQSGPDAQNKEDVEKLVQEGKTVYVPKNPITHYAGKNPEEAFCEALSYLVIYGPRTVHPLVRQWLHTVLPNLREGMMQVKGYQAVPKPYTQPESRSGDTFRVSDYIRLGLTGSTVEISQLMKTLSSFEEQNPYPTTIVDYLPKDTSMAEDVEGFEAVPPPVGKAAVDYARKQLHMINPLISDFEKTRDLKWLVTVTSKGKDVEITVDPHNQKVLSVN